MVTTTHDGTGAPTTKVRVAAAAGAIAPAEVSERPALAPGVEPIGEMQGTGFAEQQWLVQRDGHFLQVTELLYRVVEQINGTNTLEDIAAAVTESTEWGVTADHVRQIIRAKLIPLGLVLAPDGSTVRRAGGPARSPLQIKLRRRVLSPRVIDGITNVLQHLYAPPVLTTLLLVTAVAYGWLYLVHGVAHAVRAALYVPAGLLLVLALTIVSAIVHEFGHAAALRYGGGKVRGIGMGLYMVYPTFYTDTTDAYRLGRMARLRTDLGGIYFHLLFGLALIALYLITGHEILLAAIVVISGDIAYQLIPVVRLDGYWALADLTGVPDPLSQMRPFLRSILPVPGSAAAELPTLKRGAHVAFIAYIALMLPVLALLLAVMVWQFPAFITTIWDALLVQTRMLSLARVARDGLQMVAVIAQAAMLVLSLLALVYFLGSIAGNVARALWRWNKPARLRRVAAAAVAVAVVSLVANLWAPAISRAHRPLVSGVQTFEVTERSHVLTPVAYPQMPPVGGNHHSTWQNCGFYKEAIASEDGVHALERGAVWITYRPGLTVDELGTLRRLARRQSHVLVSPYPGLPARVVASAWGRQIQLSSAYDPLLEPFVRAFRLGSQAPERGAPCANGVGEPQ